MELTRRAFSRGMGGVMGSALAPRSLRGSAFASESTHGGWAGDAGVDDAYQRLLSEYIRVEEAAIATGRQGAGAIGAQTWQGRQLENFIGHLDGRVEWPSSGRDLYAEFKDHIRAEVERLKARLRREVTGQVPEPDVLDVIDEPSMDKPHSMADDDALSSEPTESEPERWTKSSTPSS